MLKNNLISDLHLQSFITDLNPAKAYAVYDRGWIAKLQRLLFKKR